MALDPLQLPQLTEPQLRGLLHLVGERARHQIAEELRRRAREGQGGPTPDRVPSGPDTRKEREIQLGIRRTLEGLGFHVSDLSQDRPTRQTEGVPDLFVMGPRKFTWAEIKRPTGKLSEHQEEWHRRAREARVPLEVWRSETDAVAWALQSKEEPCAP